MDDKKICFIACVNNNRYWEECLEYLNRLMVPNGYEIDLLEIRDAQSMCAGYNEAMAATDAKYKVYLHQDVFITDPWFLFELLEIFENDASIGMVGLVGSLGIPEDAVVWHGARVSRIYRENNTSIDSLYEKAVYDPSKIVSVEGVDGLLIATSVDMPWREDVFDGWDFYDLSQSREFINAGYKVVVPDYERPFAVHDDGMVLNLTNYDRYRMLFLERYCAANGVNKQQDIQEVKISIIMPCYNVEQWVDRCLESLEQQTVGIEALEIICVDDCSTDTTVEHLLKWEQRYPDNIMIVQLSENGRQGQARNIGLEHASGKWIAFIDSDDWVETDYIESMLLAASFGDFEIICCGDGRDPSNYLNLFAEERSGNVTEYLIDDDNERREYIIHPPIKYSAWAKLIRKDFLIENNLLFPTHITYEDAAWGSLVMLYLKHVCVLEDKMYHYFVNESSTVLRKNSNHHLDCITAQTYLWREYQMRGFYKLYRYELEMEHIFSAYLPSMKMCCLRYEIPDYNVYLLLREIMIDRIGDYRNNPYVKKGYLSEIHMLIMVALDNRLSREQFMQLADNIRKIGL